MADEPDSTTNPHYHVGRYVTHRPDGVHIKARSTCGLKLEGVGSNESKAIDRLWEKFQKHIREVESNTR